MLHLLREDSVERAIDSYPDVDAIPDRNVALLRKMGSIRMRSLLKACMPKGNDQ